MYVGWIEDLLGKSFNELNDIGKDNLVAVNNVNSTIELRNVGSKFNYESHHALFFFDLADNNFMTMAVIKLENVKYFTRLRIKLKRNISYNGYIGSVTLFNKGRDVVITYVRENIIKAL